jgi:hypothetical protein
VRLRNGAPEDANAVMVVHRRAILGLGPPFYTEVECESRAAASDPDR